MSTLYDELYALAESVFAKEKADLVILGTPDSSGVPVEDRMRQIAEEHREIDYRIVPVSLLHRAIETNQACAAHVHSLNSTVAYFMKHAPVETWPEDLRRARALMESLVTPPEGAEG